MKATALYVTNTHIAGFRHGVYGLVTGAAMVTPNGYREPRPCLIVTFEDGAVDYFPLVRPDLDYYVFSYGGKHE